MSDTTHIDIKRLAESAGIGSDHQEILTNLLREADLLDDAYGSDIPMQPRDGRSFPLSFAQHRLWVLDQLVGGTAAYNMPLAAELTGPLDIKSILRSISEIVCRHEALRTVFRPVDDDALQTVLPRLEISVPVVDLSLIPSKDCETLARQIASTEMKRLFDLEHGPLLRSLVIRLSHQRSWLIVTIHHIVSDDWSVQILAREFTCFYRAFHNGETPDLAELPLQYVDYATWQRTNLTAAEMSEHIAYWRSKLAFLPEVTFPFASPRTQELDPPTAKEAWNIPPDPFDSLRPVAREFNTTMFVVVLTAFKLVLRHFAGQNDIVVGSDVAQRDVYDVENLIGFFINQVVLRTDFSGVHKLADAIGRVRGTVLEASAHDGCPFEHLVSALRVERMWNRMPIFQTKFVYINATAGHDALAGLEMKHVDLPSPPAKFDIALEVVESAEGLFCSLKYNALMFAKADMANVASAFRLVVDVTARDYRTSLEDIDALIRIRTSPQTQEQTPTHLNVASLGPSKRYPGPNSLHEAVAAQVQSAPDALAVIYGETTLTYRDLDRRADRIARCLTQLGVTKESIVAIYLDRGLDLVAGLLGVLKAGACWMPLDPDYPRQRLEYQLEDARPGCLITSTQFAGEIPGRIEHILQVEDMLSRECSDPLSRIEVQGENAAYLIYTSGSTGRPKGVVNTHAAIVNRLRWMQDAYRLTPDDRVLQKTPLSFDVSVWELFWPLMAGATLVMAPRDAHKDSAHLSRLIVSAGITTIHFVPSMLSAFLEEPELTQCNSLKRVIVSGEALLPALVRRFYSRSSAELHNLYGPTEAAVDVTAWHCQPQLDLTPVPIGWPIANTSVYICGAQLDPVPRGSQGEICIGGIAPARGYLNQAARTATSFVPDPFSDLPGGRMYRTGDLGRIRGDGAIEFLGRSDSQLKIRGQRVELGEIETTLLQHPGVLAASVLFHDNALGRHQLIAYICPRNAPPTQEEIRAFLSQRLPVFMLPDRFIWIDSMPLLPNGKLDRNSLPESKWEAQAPVPPRTPMEEEICRIWADVLRLPTIGVHDNFFSLGGDSILLLQVSSRARKRGLRLQPNQIFQYPTPAALAPIVESPAQTDTPSLPEPVIEAPLSPIQRWFFDQNSPAVDHFNQALMLDAKPGLRVSWLRSALQLVLKHHEAFRLRFHESACSWIQWLDETPPDSPLTVVDLSAVDDVELATLMENVILRLQGSLNVSHGPLLRVALFHFGHAAPAEVVMVMHHLVVDGVSWRIFLEDIETILSQLQAGLAPSLPPQGTSFLSWAQYIRREANEPTLQQHAPYWLDLCLKAPAPQEEVSKTGTEADARTLTIQVDQKETSALLSISARPDTRLHDILIAAVADSLSRITGDFRVRIDIEKHGRESSQSRPDVSRTIGWFTAITPVLLLIDESTPQQLLTSVAKQLRKHPAADISYGALRYLSDDVELVQRLRGLPRSVVLFNYLGQIDHLFDLSNWFTAVRKSVPASRDPRTPRAYPIEVDAMLIENSLTLSVTYDSFSQRYAEGFAAALPASINLLATSVGHDVQHKLQGFPGFDIEADEIDRYSQRFQRATSND